MILLLVSLSFPFLCFVAREVTSEEVHDGTKLKNLFDSTLENNIVKRVIGESYDSKENFQYLSETI